MSCRAFAVSGNAAVTGAEPASGYGVNKSHAGEGESPMGAKMLLLVLIALHLVAVALIVDGLRVGEPESGRPSQPWQVVEWSLPVA